MKLIWDNPSQNSFYLDSETIMTLAQIKLFETYARVTISLVTFGYDTARYKSEKSLEELMRDIEAIVTEMYDE